jgi:hypothetical protein
MPEVTIQTAKTPDRIVFLSNLAKVEIGNKIGLKVEDLDENDVKKLKLVELMTKNKNPSNSPLPLTVPGSLCTSKSAASSTSSIPSISSKTAVLRTSRRS